MASDVASQPPPSPPSKQAVRFTPRELCILIALVCLSGACYSWIEAAPGVAIPLLPIAILAAIGYGIHFWTGRPRIRTLMQTGIVGFLTLYFSATLLGPSRTPARKSICSCQLHNIVLALQQYVEKFGSFPPAYVADEQGKPMHSWRVLLLPYLDQNSLYKLYRFDEPWDGPNNSKLHSIRVQAYRCPSDSGPITDTSYVAIVGPQAIWPGSSTTKMADIVDGTANTVIVAEVASSGIHWMEPRDLDASQMTMLVNAAKGTGISSGHKDGANVAFADGSIRFITNKVSPSALRAALTRNGKEAEVP